MARLARLIAPEVSGPRTTETETAVERELTDLPYRLDPRPDLVEDHRDWMAVLAVAELEDSHLYGVLHGLRCGGARLELRRSARGQHYRIDYKPLLGTWDEQELRSRWLEPRRHQIKQVLDRGLMVKRAAYRSMARKEAEVEGRSRCCGSAGSRGTEQVLPRSNASQPHGEQ